MTSHDVPTAIILRRIRVPPISAPVKKAQLVAEIRENALMRMKQATIVLAF